MEENVALDSTKQKKFVRSIKGIKKLIKQKNDPEKQPIAEKVKEGRVSKKKRKERGLVYLSHIPHGFYEHEMTQYFKQFGLVTNARVIRSKRTGNSKGFAFVEFYEPSVAQIVADTMNNYLMGKRLLKAAYIPPEKQRRAQRMHWSANSNPGNDLRIKMKKAHNADRDEIGELKRVKKILKNLANTKKKLEELGINYDFFTPVDMPEALKNKNEDDAKDTDNKSNSKKESTNIKEVVSVQEKKSKGGEREKVNKAAGKKAVVQKDAKTEKSGNNKKAKPLTPSEQVNNKQIKEQHQKMLKKGVTPLEDFIDIKEDASDNDSDDSAFDSDEFEKVMQSDDEFDSNEDDNEQSDDDGESNEDVIPPQVQLGKGAPKVSQKPPSRKQKNNKPHKKTPGQKPTPVLQKFEKHNTQKRNKQFKKKKLTA